MPSVQKLPYHYVDYLCSPGLASSAGTVSLQMYMGAHKNGANAAKLFDALKLANIKDTDTKKGAYDPAVVPDSEWWIMRKGQGNDVFFRKLWDWIWDNQEQLRDSSNSTLKEIYAKYFSSSGKTNAIQRMVNDAFFGMECIGFVSNYLRHTGIWDKYKGVDNHHWRIHFPNTINNLSDVRQLDLLEWVTVGHVALIDKVYGVDKSGRLQIGMSQCSGFSKGLVGPMSTDDAFLTAGDMVAKERQYEIDGSIPVKGTVQVRRMPGLVYKQPDRPSEPSVYHTTDFVAVR